MFVTGPKVVKTVTGEIVTDEELGVHRFIVQNQVLLILWPKMKKKEYHYSQIAKLFTAE